MTYRVERECVIDTVGDGIQLEIEDGEEQSAEKQQTSDSKTPSKLLLTSIEENETHAMTTKTYGGSRANSAMGMAFPVFLAGSRVRIIKLAAIKRKVLMAALTRTPLWYPRDPLKKRLSMMGWITAPTLMN
jgi:hypothetical protein